MKTRNNGMGRGAAVAQRTVNPLVASSNLAAPAIFLKKASIFSRLFYFYFLLFATLTFLHSLAILGIMDAKQYLTELTQSIPVTSNLDVDIIDLSDHGVTLGAPLGTHINYEGTAFGGSLNTICILACYLSVHHFFRSKSISFQSLVIQDSTMNYIKPVDANFITVAHIENVESLLKAYERRSIARAQLICYVKLPNKSDAILCTFTGRFVISAQ